VAGHHSSFINHQSVWAIVPVKSLHESKRRLAHILSAGERADLIHRFLVHTLTILAQVPEIDKTLVISPDAWVLATARQQGAESLVETAVHGLNPAVTQATRFAADSGATAVLILPADLPFIERQDVAIMVKERRNEPHVVICSDDQANGTNALLISPPNNFTLRYGPGSFQQHLQEARKRGRTISIIHDSNLQFDLDTETDWHKYQFTISRSQLPFNHS
jgi:2-phospho-L-lactate guanylyltransferase